MVRSDQRSSPLMIVVLWMIVLIPLGWGIFQTVVKSLPLFHAPAAPGTISSSRSTRAEGSVTTKKLDVDSFRSRALGLASVGVTNLDRIVQRQTQLPDDLLRQNQLRRSRIDDAQDRFPPHLIRR